MTENLTVHEKKKVRSAGEQTRNVPVFVPIVDIFETEEGMTLVADLPGIGKEDLSLDLKDNTLTIRGILPQTGVPEVPGATSVYSEYEEGDFFRQFTLSEVIDQERISASLKDGVLTLFLPKVEPAAPRRITISE